MRHRHFLELSHSPNIEALQRNLVGFGAEFGFERMGAWVALVEPGKGLVSFKMVHNAPPGFAESATKNDADTKRDPVVRKLNKETPPFSYSQSDYVDSGAADLWEEQAPYGYKTGIAVTTHLGGGKRFMLGFDRERPLPSNEDKLARMFSTLQLATAHAQQAAARLLIPPSPVIDTPSLTNRELEVLKWTAAGKTASETAQILHISTHTVTFHVRALLTKLNAQNKHQAVLTALKHKLI